MRKLLSALIFMLGLVGVADAAEPIPLTDAQMDSVTAGQIAQLANLQVGVNAQVGVLANNQNVQNVQNTGTIVLQ